VKPLKYRLLHFVRNDKPRHMLGFVKAEAIQNVVFRDVLCLDVLIVFKKEIDLIEFFFEDKLILKFRSKTIGAKA